MAHLAKQIIRQQWQKRHDSNPEVRSLAVSLIRAHVEMLRKWERV